MLSVTHRHPYLPCYDGDPAETIQVRPQKTSFGGWRRPYVPLKHGGARAMHELAIPPLLVLFCFCYCVSFKFNLSRLIVLRDRASSEQETFSYALRNPVHKQPK